MLPGLVPVLQDTRSYRSLTRGSYVSKSDPPYAEVSSPDVELPERLIATSDYQRPPRENFTYVPDYSATLLRDRDGG